jgi:hypothetical protein
MWCIRKERGELPHYLVYPVHVKDEVLGSRPKNWLISYLTDQEANVLCKNSHFLLPAVV